MSSLEHLVRYESAGSGLAFRDAIYDPEDDVSLVTDCLALANADVGDKKRFLFLGVEDVVGGERTLRGVDKPALREFKQRLGPLIGDSIEPRLKWRVRATEIDGKLIGFICLEKCTNPPYLSKRAIGEKLPAGVGFVRRGAQTFSLSRAELRKMFVSGSEPEAPTAPVRIGFQGKDLADRLALPALDIARLPSELAAERLRAMLEANQQARDVFGRTETQFSRLVHAKLYGVDKAYEKHGDDTLRSELENVSDDYVAADDHYRFEVRAHKLNLIVSNELDAVLDDARLELTWPKIDGIGIADRIYPATVDEIPPDGYPLVSEGRHTIGVQVDLGTLFPERRVHAFREPLRVWARQEAAGKAIPIDYELSSEDLDEPVKGSLVIDIERAALKSV